MGKGKEGGLDCALFCGGVEPTVQYRMSQMPMAVGAVSGPFNIQSAAICVIVVLVVIALLGLGIAKIVIGAVYLHDCPVEKMIPVYLIVSGVLPILFSCSGRSSEEGNRSFSARDLCGLMGLLLQISWLICGREACNTLLFHKKPAVRLYNVLNNKKIRWRRSSSRLKSINNEMKMTDSQVEVQQNKNKQKAETFNLKHLS